MAPLLSWFPSSPDAVVALPPDGPPLTARALAARVGGFVDLLGQDGPGGRSRVLAVEDRADLLAALIACATVGDVAVLPGMMADDALRRLAAQTGSLLSPQPVDDPRALDLSLAVPRDLDPASLTLPPDDATLVRLSTSGSTGSPRLIAKTVGQLFAEVVALGERLALPDAPVVSTVPGRHIYGLLFGVLLPLRAGRPFITDTPLLPRAIERRVQQTAARTLVSVPTQLRTLADRDLPGLASLTCITSSGAPLPASIARDWHTAFGTDITEVLGSTETGGIASRQQRVDPTWRPLPGVVAHCGEDDRLHVDSPWLAPRAPRPWRTDDRATPTADGGLVLRGRADDVVKVAGKRVSVAEMTRHLLGAPGVQDAAVVARPDSARGTRLEALVAPADLDLSAVREALSAQAERITHPRLVAVDALPRTDTGKLPRAAVIDALDAATGRALRLTSWATGGEEAEGQLQVPSRGLWYDGHLPGWPVLAGVSLVSGAVVPACRRAWPDLGSPRTLPRVRFQRPVLPGSTLRLSLRRRGDQVDFALHEGDTPCARGRVGFVVPAQTKPPSTPNT